MRSRALNNSWHHMKSRCQCVTDERYHDYGGRGIKVCAEWQLFENFYTAMKDTWFEGATLDRKNNNGDYTPDNCKWSTPKEQAQNRREVSKNKLTRAQAEEIRVLYKTGQYFQRELACMYGVGQSQISNVIQGYQWPVRTTAEAKEEA